MDMMKKIKSVDLVRENCDVISVDAADIERVYLNNISSDTYIDSHGSYAKVQCADTLLQWTCSLMMTLTNMCR